MKKFAEIRTERPFFTLVLLILFGLLLLSVILAVNMGTMDISPSEIFQVVLFRLFGIGDPALYGSGPISDVIWYIRLPRIVLAIAVGMGLSVCGVVMQAVVKNPLADPYILGISSGASLGATMAIMLGIGAFLGSNFVGIAAFAGAFLISLGVMTLANIGGRSNSTKLLLAGMALSAICSAFSNFIVYFANDKNGIQTVTYWLMGSLAGAEWGGIAVVFPIVAIAAVFFWSQARRLNLMLLGDEASITCLLYTSRCV